MFFFKKNKTYDIKNEKKIQVFVFERDTQLCAQGLQCPFERAYKGVLLIPL